MKMSGSWTSEIILEFLELYEKYSVIWNPRNENNKNRRNVADAWDEIQSQLSVECTVDTLKRKKESLMAIYRFNKRKINDSAGAYKPTWFAFPLMDRFLGNVGKRRQTVNPECLQDIETESNETINQDQADVSEIKTEETFVHIDNPVVKSKRNADSSSSFGIIENNVNNTFDALPTTSQTQEKQQDKPDECDLDIYGQLVASKLKSISKRSRLFLINQIDNLIFETQLKEMDAEPP